MTAAITSLYQYVPACHLIWCSLESDPRTIVFNDTASRLNCVPQCAKLSFLQLWAGFVNMPDFYLFFFNSTSAIDYIGVGIFIFLIYKQVDQGQQNKYEVVLRSM